MSLVNVARTWVRHTITWSNSWSSWQERCFMFAFLVAAGLFGWLSTVVEFWQAAALWSAYFLALTICTRQGWLKLFGPVLFYDMITTARRSRYVVIRLLYAAILLAILCFMYVIASERNGALRDGFTIALFMFCMFILLTGFAAQIILLMFIETRVLRVLLAGLLGVTVLLFVLGAFFFNLDNQQNNPRDVQQHAAQMAENFFSMFMIVQLALVVLLTPAYVAGAISEEKDRKTMEFMLATDLHNREIILSKLLSRLSNMTLFLLTGLPILSVLQFLGGVDTHLMFAGFAATGLTMLGIGSLSILFSTLFQKPRDSIGATYMVLITYIAIGTFAFSLTEARATIMTEKLWDSADAPTLGDASAFLNAGNPLTAVIEIAMAINGVPRPRGGPVTLAGTLPGLMERYTWFHVPMSLICILWSIARLRAIALSHGERQTQSFLGVFQNIRDLLARKPKPAAAPVAATTVGTTLPAAESNAPTPPPVSWWDRFREPVGEAPMLWKELHIEGRSSRSWLVLFAGILLVLLTLGTGVYVVGQHTWDALFNPWRNRQSLVEDMNIWFRIAGSGVATLMLLMVAVRASTSITTERERDTFDALVATPLSAETILTSKLVGSMLSMRIGWMWFASMLALGIFTGGVHLLAVPIVVTAWFVYAVFFSMIGLWFSMACTTSMRATVYTVLTSLFLGGGHWIVMGMCCFAPLSLLRFDHPGDFPEYIAKFEVGMTPPVVLGICAYSWIDLERNFRNHSEFGQMMIFSLIGLFLWAMACLVIWYGVLIPKFKEIMRREELIYK
jgi:ABC-type transport system involved in multi-copper enzyme maturation permease subunit